MALPKLGEVNVFSGSVPELWLAARCFQPVVLSRRRFTRTVLPRLRHHLEHVRDTWLLSRMQPPMAVDIMSPL